MKFYLLFIDPQARSGWQAILQNVYTALMAHSGELIGVGQAIAAFAALFYIGFRVWRSIAAVEPIDLFPLFRPFVIGFAIMVYPSVLSLINGVMDPTVVGTAALVTDSDQAVATLLQQKQQAIEQSSDWQMYIGPGGSGDLDKWESLSGDADSGVFSGLSNRVKFEMAKMTYNMRNSVKLWLSEILQLLFEAAALCVNTVRIFYLIILSILGPLVFGLSVFDGFGHLLTSWLGKYLNVFLWLPVANIFGSLINQIQEEMIKVDLAQLATSGQTHFGPTDSAYLIFLLLAIVGYFTVPSVTNYIVHAGGHHLHQVAGAKLQRAQQFFITQN